ncbi:MULTISPECIES: mechanosensitive ion channel family protein [Limosilactobacillus]|uniref:Mechanosensitive ion channel family protein n=1 Tax=Limosilactobacillus balticus TaxID=2759747 RepID=A0ABS8R9Y7_9LACO|nr:MULTISPECIES: mechanosensitive ion channel family protein [Limosilactobacillus]MBB1109155.1 mechanosensitive ion channel family protein [Limosilactobacillus balticus]MBB1128193.1 mechanosensitive ion channel family protein [Limosilactobacillus balticus]MCD7132246.1 mechanosensitive ion channel family protein [Limosilactobacillus balticus]MCD7135945.1 mechanosensitive ion channel family protein [Limosilactobacillus balticus]MCD7137843.1 mechanosensitive ion channel family protein [Limosilact
MITGATSLTSKQMEQLKKAFTDLSWHEISQQLLSKFLLIIVTFVLFLMILWVGRVIIVHLFQESKKYNVLKNSNRMATVKTLVLNIYRYTCYFFLLYAVLSEIGVPVGTLIAGAGIFSLALGLGAQSLVSDIVTGFFILLEQQLDVGDTVQIGQIKGTVTALGIRTTQVTSSDGTLNFIPNRNITIVQNLSRNNMVSNVDIRITSKTPLSKVEEIVTQVNKKLVPQTKALQLKPVIVGPVVTPDGALVFRVTITAVSGKQSTVASRFLAAYLKELRINNIPIAWEGTSNEY